MVWLTRVSPLLTFSRTPDTILEKINGWGQQTYGDLSIEGIESMHYERLGDTVEQLEALTITKRMGNTGEWLALTLAANACFTHALIAPRQPA